MDRVRRANRIALPNPIAEYRTELRHRILFTRAVDYSDGNKLLLLSLAKCD